MIEFGVGSYWLLLATAEVRFKEVCDDLIPFGSGFAVIQAASFSLAPELNMRFSEPRWTTKLEETRLGHTAGFSLSKYTYMESEMLPHLERNLAD